MDEEDFSEIMEKFIMLGENLRGLEVTLIKNTFNFVVNYHGSLFTIGIANGGTAEKALLLLAVGNKTKRRTHTPFTYDAAGNISCRNKIVTGSCGQAMKNKFFGNSAAHKDFDPVFQVLPGIGISFTKGELLGKP
jgi:hypothetical protein